MDSNSTTRVDRIRALSNALHELSDSQLTWTEGVINQFKLKPDAYRNPDSDLVTPCVLETFGDVLQIHHCLSMEALSKDRFEYALSRVMNLCGIASALARRGNRGYDITIGGVPVSLNTQADKGLQRDYLHISKFMELGKGAWETEEDLAGLRAQFLRHMRSYRRILQLRRLTSTAALQEYELVEIPKKLLLKAKDGELRMMHGSHQQPKPGTCKVADTRGHPLFELYFDGGQNGNCRCATWTSATALSMARGESSGLL